MYLRTKKSPLHVARHPNAGGDRHFECKPDLLWRSEPEVCVL